ncbi:RNA recognition motif domain-containing protein [Parabacteroides sp. APC149_11_2_Y6]
MNIYVSNLSWGTSADGLQELFSQYGEVDSVKIITDRETGRSRGFGFVEMPNDSEGQKAIDELHETEFEGKTINVTVARPKTERPSRGFNNGGGGYGGGGGYRGGGNRGGGGGYNRDRGDNGGYNRGRY